MVLSLYAGVILVYANPAEHQSKKSMVTENHEKIPYNYMILIWKIIFKAQALWKELNPKTIQKQVSKNLTS